MKKHIYLVLTVMWMGVIFYFSSQNGEVSSMNNTSILEFFKNIGIDAGWFMSADTANFIIRKAAHLLEYFVLGLLLYKACRSYLNSRFEVVSSSIGFLYACTDEFHQYFIPGRGPGFGDVLIDTTGVILSVMLLSVLHYRKRGQRNIPV